LLVNGPPNYRLQAAVVDGGLATNGKRRRSPAAPESERWPPGDPPMPHAGIEAELPHGIVVAKAWDDAVRDRKTLTKDDGNS
jgi:hypothetical protein